MYDSVLLGALALAATAVSGYVLFLLWFVSYHLVRPLACIAEACALYYLIRYGRHIAPAARTALAPLAAPALLVFTSSVLILSWTFVYHGLRDPLITPQERFSHPLPGDNAIPYLFAHSMMSNGHKVPHPLVIDYLSSDRPPLQSAVVLSQYPAITVPWTLGYQVLSVELQSLWIFGLFLLLYSLKIRREAIACVLTGCLFTNFIFVQCTFVWPKMFATAYMLGFCALLFSRRLASESPFRSVTAVTAGSLLAWAFLAHGASLFALLALVPTALLFRRSVQPRAFAMLAATSVLLYIPWIFYQRFYDPPGDRLLKMHLASVYTLDSRTAGQVIADAYRALTPARFYFLKNENFTVAFGEHTYWADLKKLVFQLPPNEPERSAVRLATVKDLNGLGFFYFACTMGLYQVGLLAIPFGVFRRFRSPEWKIAAMFLVFVILGNVIWCLVMFGPGTTFVHQGTYVTVMLGFSASILALWAVSRTLAVAVTAVQVALFGYIHVFLLVPYGETFHPTLATLSAMALAGTAYLLYQVATFRLNQRDPDTLVA